MSGETDMAAEQLAKIEQIGSLKSGGHKSFEHGACVMEAASYIAGEPWSDHPECVSPVIGAFLRSWNDGLPDDATRTRLLKPLLPKILDTRADTKTEERRSYMALDWMIRVYLPTWLRAAKLEDQATKVETLTPIVDMATAEAAAPVVRAARDAAWAVALPVALPVAWAAARAAARAAGAAAGAAARAAAEAAAGAVALDAAASAAAAAGAAAGSALTLTVEKLQASAVELVERMYLAGDKS